MASIPQTALKINPDGRFLLRNSRPGGAQEKTVFAEKTKSSDTIKQKSINCATTVNNTGGACFQHKLTFGKMMLEKIAKADRFRFKNLS